MYGDFSRSHFSLDDQTTGIYMQQGRVQLDSDWNAQAHLLKQLRELQTSHIIGRHGAPDHLSGFSLSAHESHKHKLKISAGYYYVDGVLCRNNNDVTLDQQITAPAFKYPTERGWYMAYLECWEDTKDWLSTPAIREIALGGQDTTMRSTTQSRVKMLPLHSHKGDAYDLEYDLIKILDLPAHDKKAIKEKLISQQFITHAHEAFNAWQGLSHPHHKGKIAVSVTPQGVALDNLLYRFTIHDEGDIYGEVPHKHSRFSRATNYQADSKTLQTASITIAKEMLSHFTVGSYAELFDQTRQDDHKNGSLVQITSIDVDKNALTLSSYENHILPKTWDDSALHIRPIASFLWSRNNGSIMTQSTACTKDTISVHDHELHRNAFQPGACISITTEKKRLSGRPDIIAIINNINDNIYNITVPSGEDISALDQPLIIRLWDHAPIPIQTGISVSHGVIIENGITLNFSTGRYITNDYWTLTVRNFRHHTWPKTMDGQPEFLPPEGVHYQYAPLSLIFFDGEQWQHFPKWDMRNMFPPLGTIGRQLQWLKEQVRHMPRAVPDGCMVLSPESAPPEGYNFSGASMPIDCWHTLKHMPTPRKNFSSAQIDHYIYVAGGTAKNGQSTNAVELYDTKTGEWRKCAPMNTPRSHLGLAAANGKLYAFGGRLVEKWEDDILIEQVKTSISIESDDHSTEVIEKTEEDDTLIILHDELKVALDLVERYDPETDTWDTLERPMPTAGYAFATCTLNGKIHTIGGIRRYPEGFFGALGKFYDALVHGGSSHQVFDPHHEEWHEQQALPTHVCAPAVTILNDQIHILGGLKRHGTTEQSWVYDSAIDAWEEGIPLPEKLSASAAYTWKNNLYIMGGYNHHHHPTDRAWMHNTITQIWSEDTPMLEPFAAGGVVKHGEKIYTIGGEHHENNLSTSTTALHKNQRFYLLKADNTH